MPDQNQASKAKFGLSASMIDLEDHETMAAGDEVSHLDCLNESEMSESLSGGHSSIVSVPVMSEPASLWMPPPIKLTLSRI